MYGVAIEPGSSFIPYTSKMWVSLTTVATSNQRGRAVVTPFGTIVVKLKK
ncbi:diaminopimelate decarboxylase [Lactococcus lactis subsp. lactis]|uniref:Diaminopimelate decarboxylase n=1 Tax=Lactococcus lactis subsp. lactis TaxID=1360 RepID=A0A0B8QMQ9_LACLL|nr:hypothetical protein ATCC19435_0618 [Lactococcus lactis subsp. lactis]MDN6077182.1 hypothetical protein [Lactococcus lactis]PCS14785.1 hypothetical protein RU91_GL001567 [Lactococcus lactis subsp. lactis]GAM81315.1 diaminopimelate decarboxylase [Lactococcus lactis subsp. lactis]CDI47427.1 hypothetical protein BN927_00347 [Lactococcus lactis subsp. lactis Dephy 1]